MAHAPLRAVLFDADGVLQRRRPGFVRGLLRLGGPRFLLDAMRAEVSCLTGEHELVDVLSPVVARHRIGESPEQLAARWLEIELDPRRLALVDALRHRGITCVLATNQQRYRGAHMRAAMHLDRHFDHAFYSYEVGLAKPDPAFFELILARIVQPPEAVMFVDDLPGNVRGARRLGIDARLHVWATGASGLQRTLASRIDELGAAAGQG